MITIDYDFNPKHFKDKNSFVHICHKIGIMSCCKGIDVKDSDNKGKHIIIHCLKNNCDLCRFVYDDTERYRKDIQRPKYAQNVLFQQKNLPLTANLQSKVFIPLHNV